VEAAISIIHRHIERMAIELYDKMWYHRDIIHHHAHLSPHPPQRAEQESMSHGQPTQSQRNGRLLALAIRPLQKPFRYV
jgi:hypothetical protein